MKSKFLRSILSGVLLATVAASAGSLQRNSVPANSVWVLHADCDGLRQTAVGRYLLTELEKPDAQKKFAAFQTIFSFDPRQALHGLTLYGISQKPEDGVLLVNADFDAARLTTLAEGAKAHQSTEHGKYTIHSWIDEKKPARNGTKPRTYAAIHGATVIFGQKEERVADALDVLAGIKTSLVAGKDFPNLGAAGGKSFIQGAARKIELPESDPNAAVLKQSKSLALDVAESDNRFAATLNLEADSEDVAKQVSSIANGLIGLMTLKKDKPDSVKLAQGLSVEQNGVGVTVKLNMVADEVIALLKNAAAQKVKKE